MGHAGNAGKSKPYTGKPKGGMAANPFGGSARLDRLDLMQFLEANAPPEKILYLETIADAVHNYLFFALGRNGTSAEEFASATQYLFTVRSGERSTWEHAREMVTAYKDDRGKLHNRTDILTDAQLVNSCFDVHYEFSGLTRFMPLDRFVSWLEKRRKEILDSNLEQVLEYMAGVQELAAREIAPGHQIPLRLAHCDLLGILAKPSHPSQVAGIMYYPTRYTIPLEARA